MKSMTLVNFMTRLEEETTIPLGPLYITAVLEEMGCCVDFRDYQLTTNENPLSQKNIVDFLSDSDDIVGISCIYNALPFVLLSLEKLKAETPEKTIILGGPGPSSVAEKVMERFPFIDVVVKGEGEHTIKDLAKGLPYKDIKGIVYRSNGKVVSTPERERIRNLDELPFPAYDRIDFSQYNHVGIITARGCPYHCTFCEVAPLWGYHTERRSVQNVIAEIKTLYSNFGVKDFHFNDDTFVLGRKWVLDFCDALKDEEIDVTWRCLGRINLMDEELLSIMADSGCIGVQYGIESGSEHVLKMIGKKITVPQIREVIKLSADYIENVFSTFMWGFPFETMEDFYQTVYVMGEVAEMGSLITLFLLTPTPLSPLYREYCDQLKFSEELVSNLLWGVFDGGSPEEKNQILEMILQNPDMLSGFYHVYTPDLPKKYKSLKQAGLLR